MTTPIDAPPKKKRRSAKQQILAICRGQLRADELHGRTRNALIKRGWLDEGTPGIGDYFVTPEGRRAAGIENAPAPAPAEPDKVIPFRTDLIRDLKPTAGATTTHHLQGQAKGLRIDEFVPRLLAWYGPNRVGKTARLEVARAALGLPSAEPADRSRTGQLEGPSLCGMVPATHLLELGPTRLRDAIAERFATESAAATTGGLSETQRAKLNEHLAKTQHVAAWGEKLNRIRASVTAERTQVKAKRDVSKERVVTAGADIVASGAATTVPKEQLQRRLAARKWWDEKNAIERESEAWRQAAEAFEKATKEPDPPEALAVECEACGNQTSTHRQALFKRRLELRAEKEALWKRHAQLGPQPPIKPEETEQQLLDAIQLHEQSYASLAHQEDEKRALGQYTAEYEELTELLAWVKQAQTAASAGAISTLIERVNQALPKGLAAVYEKDQISLVGTDGQAHHKFSSGAEHALLALALALAWRPDGPNDAPSVLLLEFEKHLAPLDPELCIEVLAQLRDDPRVAGIWLSTTRWIEASTLKELGFEVRHIDGGPPA